jgi:hypothetical protein
MNGSLKGNLEALPTAHCYGMGFDGTYLWAGTQGIDTVYQILPNGTYTGVNYAVNGQVTDLGGVGADSLYIYVSDITGYKIVDLKDSHDIYPSDKNIKFRFSKYYQINHNCFYKIEPRPCSRLHNLIMGAGKTTMITPLVIIKYLQFLSGLNISNISL